jgi:ABC-type multidrug transport system ATPase subunit
MDEAEYCHRVGLMRSGKLLAFDTPTHLKNATLRADAWNITSASTTAVFSVLEKLPDRIQVSLLGDRVHLITSRGKLVEAQIIAALFEQGIHDALVEPGEITLEDIFINLTHKAELTPG